jgi:hypothetical protein
MIDILIKFLRYLFITLWIYLQQRFKFVLKDMRRKPVISFLPSVLRTLLPGLLVFNLIATPLSPLTSSAFALDKSPPVPIGIETMKSGIFGKPNEVADFVPHFGALPITVPAPVPTYGRGLWCYGPIYICYIVGCSCIPLPRNWCNEMYECMMTNMVNLEATLQIKHAWPEGGERLREHSNLTVLKPDNYYRDMCATSAAINYDKFDPKTGQLIVEKVKDPVTGKDTSTPVNTELYDDKSTGTVVGAKPAMGTCMPRVNNTAFANRDPKYAIPTNGNAAFSYYVNAGDDPFAGIGKDDEAPETIYGTSNRYLSTTFFLSGRFGCPSDISGIPVSGKITAGSAEAAAKIWKEAASKCYDYFIFQRATHPEWTLERAGTRTDDPLTLDETRGGNPDLAIFNSCQPLMSGDNSRAVFKNLSPVGRGFAPVLQYQRPDLDEADYSPREQLQRNWAMRFPGKPAPGFQNVFPCIKDMADAGTIVQTDWEDFNRTLMINYGISFFVESTVLRLTWGPQFFIPMSNEPYSSPGSYKSGFCPNVEKINIPTHPFAPRNDIRSLQHPKGISYPTVAPISKEDHELDLRASGLKYFFNRNATDVYFTDREYSYQTGWLTPEDRWSRTWTWGYSDYKNPAKELDPSAQIEYEKNPEVMCAVVPVDILEPRRKAFNSCIMERINFNFLTWRRRNFLSYYYSTQNGDGGLNLSLPVNPIAGDIFSGVLLAIPAAITAGISFLAGKDGTLKPWVKPCKTRFYEHDTFEECPVAMSIQQCCRIIVKDVVPMNYIKIRTCEGLRQKRDMVFNFDHIFDYSQRAIDTFKDDWAIANAKTPEEKAAAERIVLIKQLETPVPIVSQGGRSVPTPTSREQYFSVYDLNQKLTALGCDNTEPETMTFAHYFPLSPWSDPTKNISPILSPAFNVGKATIPITKSLEELRKLSDKTIEESRNLASTATNIEGASANEAWNEFLQIKNTVDEKINEAKELKDKLVAEEQEALKRKETAERNAKVHLTPHNVILLGLGSIPKDVPQEIATEVINANADWVKKKGIAYGAAATYEQVKSIEEATLGAVEEKAKSLMAKWLQARQDYIVSNGKTAADKIVTETVGQIKVKYGSTIAEGIDGALSLAKSNQISELAMVKQGAGGSNMPYMRRWDTGTSAGNPLHGGSFINTLGSYDVVIGVGHEERTFNDATNTTTDIRTVQDADAIAAALKRLEAARNRYNQLRNSLFSRANGMASFMMNFAREHQGDGLQVPTGTKVYFGKGDDEDKVFFDYIRPGSNQKTTVPAIDICNLWRSGPKGVLSGGYGHAEDCNPDYTDIIGPINTQMPIAKKELKDAEAAFQEARHKSVTTFDTTSDRANIPAGESLIKNAHIGRINGWDGVKGHQMLSLYRKNLSCIGRHEKLFKYEGAENFVLHRAGTGYKSKSNEEFPWPLAWRGYITDPDNEFEKNKNALLTGLDRAEAGDIAIYTISGMKRIGYIAYVNKTSPQFVKIESWDQGKFPTAAGASLTLGNSIDRTIYKSIIPAMEKIDKLEPDKAAKIGGKPSCEDPSYTSCVLGGSLDIIGEDGKVVENIPNSTWDTVTIYRPSLDTVKRQCPMIDNSKDAEGNLKTPLSEMPSDSIAFCVNAGFDPPIIPKDGYRGAGTGAINDTTLCGPQWGSCDFYSDKLTKAEQKKEILCFPGREVCSQPGSALIPPPPTDSEDVCTPEEYAKAMKDYEADLKKISAAKLAASEKIREANREVEKAAAALNDYKNKITAELAEKRVGEAKTDATAKLEELKQKLADAQKKLAEANAIAIPAPIIGADGTVTNQAEIDSATRLKNAEIERWNIQVMNLTAEINRQNNILCVTGALNAAIEDLKAKQAAAVAARNNYYKYVEEHPFDDNTPREEHDQIISNIAKLRDAADKAAREAEAAQQRVAQLMKTMDCLSPPKSTTDQDAANARIKELEEALANAVKKADELQEDSNALRNLKLPQMNCPYEPVKIP